MTQEYSSNGRRSPLFGHETQCYNWDNKCHCVSSQPFRLPPEGYSTSQASQEPPLTVKLTTQQVRDQYTSLKGLHHHPVFPTHHIPTHPIPANPDTPCPLSGHEWAREASGGRAPVSRGSHAPVSPQTPMPPESRENNLPPSYESLFGSSLEGPQHASTRHYKGT